MQNKHHDSVIVSALNANSSSVLVVQEITGIIEPVLHSFFITLLHGPRFWEWVGGPGVSTVSEFNLICGDEYKVGLAQSVLFIGGFLGKSSLVLVCFVLSIPNFRDFISPFVQSTAYPVYGQYFLLQITVY